MNTKLHRILKSLDFGETQRDKSLSVIPCHFVESSLTDHVTLGNALHPDRANRKPNCHDNPKSEGGVGGSMNPLRKLLCLFSIIVLQLDCLAAFSLQDIYQFSSTAQSYVSNQIVKDYMVGGYLGPISGFSKWTLDNFSGAGECIVKCDLNGNGIPDYAIWGAGIANLSSASVTIIFDVTNPEALLQTDQNHALAIKGPEVEELVVGDINGDGIDDLVVGDVTRDEGSVWILFGKASIPHTGTLSAAAWDTYIGCAGWSGANPKECFGKHLCILDLNDDGINDLAVTAYGRPDFGLTYGVVALFWGRRLWPTQMEATTDADFVIHGTTVFDHTGAYLAKGDLNKDGIEDLIFTSYYFPGPGAGGERGKAWILYGGATYPKEIGKRDGGISDRYYEQSYTNSFFTSIEKWNAKGFAFPAVGDFNGDGKPDLILGNGRYDEGAVTVIYGPLMPDQRLFVESIANKTIIFPNEFPQFISAQFGQSIKTTDVDGDGCTDLLIGAKGYSRYKTGSRTGEGGAFLFLGNTNPPARIPTSAAAVRFQFEPTTFLEAGLGLSHLQFNNTNYAAIGDPVQGKIVLWPLPTLPRVEVANFYAALKAVENTFDDYLFRALPQFGTQPILDVSPIVSTWQIETRQLTNPIPNLNLTSNLTANLQSIGTNFNILAQWQPVLAKIDSAVNDGLSVDLKFTLNLLPNAAARGSFVQAFKAALSTAGLSPITCTILRDVNPRYTIGNYFGQTGLPAISGNDSFWNGNQVVFFDSVGKLTPSSTQTSNGVVALFGNVSASVYRLPVDVCTLNPVSRYYDSRALPNVTDCAIGYDGAVRPHIVLLFKDASGNVIDRAYRLLPYEVLGMENGATRYGGTTFVIHSENTYGSQYWRFSRKVYNGSGDSSPLVIKQKMSFDSLQKIKSIEVFLADFPLPGDNGTPATKPGSTTTEVQAAIYAISATNSLRDMWRPALESAHLVTDASLGKVMVVDFTMVPDKNRLKRYYADVKSALSKRYYSIPYRPQVARAPKYSEYLPLTHPSEASFFEGIQDYREANLVWAFNYPVHFFANSSVGYQPDYVLPGVEGPMGYWDYYWDGLDTEAFFVAELQFQSVFFPTLSDRYESIFYCNDTQLPSVIIEFRDINNTIVKAVTNALSFDALGQTPFARGTGPTAGRLGQLFHYEQQTAHQYYFTPSSRGIALKSYDYLGLNQDSTGIWRFHVGTQLTDAQASNILNVTFAGNAAPPPTITSVSLLPNAMATQNYCFSLRATGGDAPYQWQIVDGSLPNGLTMSADGIISGTPTLVCTSAFVAQVIGANGTSSTKSLRINIVDVSAPAIAAHFVTGGSFGLEINVSMGMNCRLEVSTNLLNWSILTSFVSTNTTMQFRDPVLKDTNQRFYRAIVP